MILIERVGEYIVEKSNITNVGTLIRVVGAGVTVILAGCSSGGTTSHPYTSFAPVASVGATADDSALGAAFGYEIKGGKKCRVGDHTHTGSGDSSKTGEAGKIEALRIAIAQWNSFTQWEYGAKWNWENAGNKQVHCEIHSNGQSCTIEANPCRLLETVEN